NVRNEMNVAPSKRLSAYVIAKDEKFISSAAGYLNKLAGIGEVKFVKSKDEIGERTTAVVTHDAEILIPLGELIDEKKEIERINAEIAETEAIIKKTQGLLANAAFVAKAPQKLVDNEREKLEKAQDKLAKLKDKLSMFA
ncbi:MAG: valine--tRNA ligase, partial [Clostridia bacterium]|nr:valine--tRNA ligase [Clostridia bacterium]